ncbi:MAG: hypothetical protein MR469_08850 [Campylobacter sp.]|uniref:hypothetical protein n=1 Tax=Campylobacter sp. TaxID=205 RepID=UPI002AA8F867|nr:hypothetical protein [Campylobacter sp.]MCI6695724.1 hypothetical protein [Campylobacter sp.]
MALFYAHSLHSHAAYAEAFAPLLVALATKAGAKQRPATPLQGLCCAANAKNSSKIYSLWLRLLNFYSIL